ncbi:hypothetical protein [Aquimarina aquimarini]|uniref:hypothetical protein n=1 Tax=Aquimarina aquimarini TaxID=1191734 RepID=UPI000D54E3ED|nr:hypothetical protein [Aquimarina aquimarini]
MDTIEFGIVHSNVDDYLTTTIYINGYDLKDILGSIEINQVKKNDDQFMVGAYEGISPFIAFHTHNHFLKDTVNEYIYFDNRFVLLEYINSGIPGDHTIACNIDIYQDTVKWSNFKNFSILSESDFKYEELSFSFDRKQYEKAIEEMVTTEINTIYG